MTSASTFNLEPPPGFRGLHPDLPVEVYQRHLPHWRQQGATYFVTFRLGDALPQDKLQFLKRLRAEWERTHPFPRSESDWEGLAREFTTRAERWLDEGYGECFFRERRWFDDLRDRINHFQEQRYLLSCWVIMPNHCHVVIRPFDGHSLEDLLGAMKGVTARHINVALSTTGALWEEECYDRIVRDEEHLWRVIQYIGRNPRMAGLESEAAWRRWMHPAWEAAGWRFLDED
jgi:putative transposase